MENKSHQQGYPHHDKKSIAQYFSNRIHLPIEKQFSAQSKDAE